MTGVLWAGRAGGAPEAGPGPEALHDLLAVTGPTMRGVR